MGALLVLGLASVASAQEPGCWSARHARHTPFFPGRWCRAFEVDVRSALFKTSPNSGIFPRLAVGPELEVSYRARLPIATRLALAPTVLGLGNAPPLRALSLRAVAGLDMRGLGVLMGVALLDASGALGADERARALGLDWEVRFGATEGIAIGARSTHVLVSSGDRRTVTGLVGGFFRFPLAEYGWARYRVLVEVDFFAGPRQGGFFQGGLKVRHDLYRTRRGWLLSGEYGYRWVRDSRSDAEAWMGHGGTLGLAVRTPSRTDTPRPVLGGAGH